jgi:hypothetical protein
MTAFSTDISSNNSLMSDDLLIQHEIEAYLAYPSQNMLQENNGQTIISDPLDWWKNNERSFNILVDVVKELFCIPATSAGMQKNCIPAPSERVF